ncbi:YdfR family protein [Escherichia coli]|uniref:YdfR family protein n=2 Tax=Escherichia coli TaxID=562 RepID=UPI000B3F3FB7|nr:YdfR family protein [Escherichia coli]
MTVTVALEIGGYPSLLLPDVAISLDRTEGATLEFYEAEAKKQAKQFFMDVAAGLCEGDGPLPEKRPVILEAQDVLITYRGKLPGICAGGSGGGASGYRLCGPEKSGGGRCLPCVHHP